MHARSIKNVSELIDAFGGPSAFARAVGLTGSSTASEMKRARGGQGSIDVKYWPAILRTAQRHDILGLDERQLLRLHTQTAEAC